MNNFNNEINPLNQVKDIESISIDDFYKILSFVDAISLLNISMASHSLYELIKESWLWESIYHRDVEKLFVCPCVKRGDIVKKVSLRAKQFSAEGKSKYLVFKRKCLIEAYRRLFFLKISELSFSKTKFPIHEWISTCCVLNDRYAIMTGIKPIIYLWSVSENKFVKEFKIDQRLTVVKAIKCNGYIICGTLEGVITVWTYTDKPVYHCEEEKNVCLHTKAVFALAGYEDTIVSGSDDKLACIWSLSTSEVFKVVSCEKKVKCVDINAKWIVISGYDCLIHLVSHLTFETVFVFSDPTFDVFQVKLSRDSSLVSFSRDEKIRVFDLNKKTCEIELSYPFSVNNYQNGVYFIDQYRILVNDFDGCLYVICLKCYSVIKKSNTVKTVQHAIPYKKMMIVTTNKEEIQLWDLEKMEKIKSILNLRQYISSDLLLSTMKIYYFKTCLFIIITSRSAFQQSIIINLKLPKYKCVPTSP